MKFLTDYGIMNSMIIGICQADLLDNYSYISKVYRRIIMLEEKSICSEYGRTCYWVSRCNSDINLVFLPGLTANHRLFEKQINNFKSKYNIVVWDCPAHGKSRPYSKFTYSNVAAELKEILDIEKIEQAIFVGQSLGGMIAQYFINTYPTMALGLISIDSAPFGDYYSKTDLFWLKQLEWMCKLFPDKTLRKSMAKMCGVTSYSQNKMIEMLSDYTKNELCHLMYIGEAAFIPENVEMELPCKVLLILGEKDKVGKVSQYNKRWAEKTNYPLRVIKNAAHNSNDDQPEIINELIEDFICNL